MRATRWRTSVVASGSASPSPSRSILISPGLPFVPAGGSSTCPAPTGSCSGSPRFLYVYGGMPFLKGFVREARDRTPGMMTLVAVAITVAYFYSAATVFGLDGMPFFWELATLIDIMLLGHWIEMRSVGEASKALESLAKLMPARRPIGAARRRHDRRAARRRCSPATWSWSGQARRCPPTATVVEGASAVDESMLTGESVPGVEAPRRSGHRRRGERRRRPDGRPSRARAPSPSSRRSSSSCARPRSRSRRRRTWPIAPPCG